MLKYLRENERLFILCVAGMITLLGMGLVSPILPLYARDFGLSITMVGLVIAAFGAARAIMDIPAGKLSDIFGRKPILIVGTFVLAAGSIGSGLATEYWHLILFRIVQGAGSGLFNVAAMVMVADISDVTSRGRNMAYFQGCMWIGFGLGPFLGGVLGNYLGMRAVFYVYALLGILSGVWTYARLPETRPAPAPATGGSELPAGHVAATFRQIKTMMSDVNFVMICLISFALFMFSNGSRNQILPLLAHDRLDMGISQTGLALSIVAGINVVIMFAAGRLSDSMGRKPLIMPGCILTAGSLVVIALANSYAFLILGCVIMGIGVGIAGATPAAYVGDILTSENQSTGLSIFRALSDIGMMIGPILLGWLADMQGYNFSLYVAAIMLAVVAIAFQVLAREHPSFTGKA